MNGAKDLSSKVAIEPNALPRINYFGVYDTTYEISYHEDRVDDLWYNPFLIPNNTDLNIIFDIEDDTTHNLNLSYNKLLISTNINDFSQAIEFQATCVDSEQYGYPFIIQLNSSLFNINQQYFMRYYTKMSILKFQRNLKTKVKFILNHYGLLSYNNLSFNN